MSVCTATLPQTYVVRRMRECFKALLRRYGGRLVGVTSGREGLRRHFSCALIARESMGGGVYGGDPRPARLAPRYCILGHVA